MLEFAITQLEPNEEVVCVGSEGYNGILKKFHTYTSLYGIERGVFSGSPYVTVQLSEGRTASAHLARFIKPADLPAWKDYYNQQ